MSKYAQAKIGGKGRRKITHIKGEGGRKETETRFEANNKTDSTKKDNRRCHDSNIVVAKIFKKQLGVCRHWFSGGHCWLKNCEGRQGQKN
jgi:hypothetical protein